MLSVLIAARNEKYLEPTIRSVLDAAEGEIEVLVALDGYLPEPRIEMNDDRVTFIHHEESIGQRQSINELARMAKGKYIMKLDAHCMVGPGFDVILARDCEYSWTMVPRMYNLDVYKWEPKWHKRTDYMYITSPSREEQPFRAQYYEGKAKDARQRAPKNDTMIDDIMCCMGPGWFMHKDRFFEQGGCDENHGSWGQQGIEVSLKAWLSGGALKVNKNTWFAHWFRGSDGGFPYPASGREHEAARRYSRDLWLNNKWDKQVRPLSWLVEKFKPPLWPYPYVDEWLSTDINKATYRNIIKARNYPRWRGQAILKDPSDLMLYAEAIQTNKPDFIIETGTKWGGSTLFLADMCEIAGHGQVISVDIAPRATPEHPRITYITGSSIDDAIIGQIKSLISGSVMVILDSDHRRQHVKWELKKYRHLVTPGQFLVVEDLYDSHMRPAGPFEAVEWFLKGFSGWQRSDFGDKVLTGMTRGGWLCRK